MSTGKILPPFDLDQSSFCSFMGIFSDFIRGGVKLDVSLVDVFSPDKW